MEFLFKITFFIITIGSWILTMVYIKENDKNIKRWLEKIFMYFLFFIMTIGVLFGNYYILFC